MKAEVRALRQQLDASPNVGNYGDSRNSSQEVAQLHTEYALVESKLRDAEETCHTLRDQVARLTNNARAQVETEYRSQVNQLKSALSNKTLECSRLESELHLAKTVPVGESTDVPPKVELTGLRNQIASLTLQLQSTRTQLQNKESINDCLMESVKDEQLRIDALVEEVARLEKEKAELQKQNRRLSTEANNPQSITFDRRIDASDRGQSREVLLEERNTALTRGKKYQDKADEMEYQLRCQTEELARMSEHTRAITSAKLFVQHSLDNALSDNAEMLQTLRKMQVWICFTPRQMFHPYRPIKRLPSKHKL